MNDAGTVFGVLLGLYGLAAGIFLVSDNRRPQASIAWMLVFVFIPGIGLLVYILFGRQGKAFSKQTSLLMQDLEKNARPILGPILERQDAAIAELADAGPIHGKLMTLVRRNSYSALTGRNRVEIQQDASCFYASLIEDLKAARHSIHLQYFIWRADQFTESLKDVLIAKANAGVHVRLLYDPLGSQAHLSVKYLRELREGGVQASPTTPLYRLHTLSYRNHRKITVIDGTIGYTGGMNIGQEHLDGGKGFDSWRDTQVRITGEAAAVLQAVFMIDWYNAVKEDLFTPEYFPADPVVPSADAVPVQILTSGPDSRWAAIRQLYFLMIASARRNVYLQSPYFVLDASLTEALRSAALAGVDVQVMLSARSSGNPLPEWAGNTYIDEVIDAGVRVFLYEKGYLHAKTVSVDSEICSIGTTNIDIRSFSINYEINAVLYSRRLAETLERDFERDLLHCTEFDRAEYGRRHPAVRFRDSLARVFSPLL